MKKQVSKNIDDSQEAHLTWWTVRDKYVIAPLVGGGLFIVKHLAFSIMRNLVQPYLPPFMMVVKGACVVGGSITAASGVQEALLERSDQEDSKSQSSELTCNKVEMLAIATLSGCIAAVCALDIAKDISDSFL